MKPTCLYSKPKNIVYRHGQIYGLQYIYTVGGFADKTKTKGKPVYLIFSVEAYDVSSLDLLGGISNFYHNFEEKYKCQKNIHLSSFSICFLRTALVFVLPPPKLWVRTHKADASLIIKFLLILQIKPNCAESYFGKMHLHVISKRNNNHLNLLGELTRGCQRQAWQVCLW